MVLCAVLAIQSCPAPVTQVDNIPTAGNTGTTVKVSTMLPGDFVFGISLFDCLSLLLRFDCQRDESLAVLARLLPSGNPELLTPDIDAAGEIWVSVFLFTFVVEQGSTVGVVVFFAHLFCIYLFLFAFFDITRTKRMKVSGVTWRMLSLQALM